MPEHERALIERARGGNRDAFAELVEPLMKPLHWQAFRVLGHAQDAQDVVQETLLRAWKALPSFRLPEEEARAGAAFRAWCLQIARHTALDHRAARARTIPKSAPDPGAFAERAESGADLALAYAQAVALLTPRQMEAFELTLIEGYSAEEAAARMGVAASTVRNLTLQARERLRESFRRE